MRAHTYRAFRRSPNKLAKSLQTYRKQRQNIRPQEVGKDGSMWEVPHIAGMTLGHKVKVGVMEA